MQVQGKDVIHGARYSSPLDCAVKTLESEGVSSTGLLLLFSSFTVTRPISCFALQVKGIFRGGLATLFREAIGNAVFFCTYEYSRYWMHNYLDSSRFSGSSHFVAAKDIGIGVVSGGVSGMAVSIYNCLNSFAVHFLHPHYDSCVFSLQFWTATLPLDVAKTIIQTDPDPHVSRNPLQILSMVMLLLDLIMPHFNLLVSYPTMHMA
jgi:solute carrier family 25 (mitochondrial carnitine/acylcarnitine transporter), member 20/29